MRTKIYAAARPLARRLGLGRLRRRIRSSRTIVRPSRIDPAADLVLMRELRELGPEEAIHRYERMLHQGGTPTVAYKLARTLALVGKSAAAVEVLDRSSIAEPRASLLKLGYLVRAGERTETLTSLVSLQSRRDFLEGMSLLGKSVTDAASFSAYLSVAKQARPAWAEDPSYLTRLGHACRRAGRADVGVQYFEQAVRSIQTRGERINGTGAAGLDDPWTVLDDLLDVAGKWRNELFPVAATLLGFVREGGFISHDYDIDLGVRSEEAHRDLRERLRVDWRFEVDRGRSPDVLKAHHINGTTVDIYLFRRYGDGWSTQSHVYGWRFDDFDLEELELGQRSVRVPTDAAHYLAQMYGPEWRVPQPGFESGLYAPNCFFPDRLEIICAVLNKVVSAVRGGRVDKVERYREFLQDVCAYEMPQVGSSVGAQQVVLDAQGSATVDSSEQPPALGFVAEIPAPVDVSGVVETSTAPHKSRSRRPLDPPSFRVKMDERIRQRRYLKDYTNTVAVSQVLTNKGRRDRIFSGLRLPVPTKLLDGGTAEEVVDLLQQHEELVVKPAKGAGSRGVMLLRRVSDGWLDLRKERVLTLDQISEAMSEVRIENAPVRRWFAEKLVAGTANASGYPMDYKLYMFQEHCGLVLAKCHLPGGSSYKWFSPQWDEIDTGKYGSALDPALPPPKDAERTLALAASIATQFPLPFVRVDLIEGRDGLVLSELSPLPGQYHRFVKDVDVALGALWEIAELEYGPEFLTAPRFTRTIQMIKEVSGARRLYPN